jgi:peptide/nickel transport system substrate-binding protein
MLPPAAAEPAKYGGTLTVALGSGDPDTLDPDQTHSIATHEVLEAICLKLYGLNANGTLLPLLAASRPQLSADKLTYTIQLRHGILFNDGTPFNAHAVVDEITPGAGSDDTVASVRATGPYTVAVRMAQRDSSFVANPYVRSPAAVASEGANFGQNPVCAGPFMFDHRDPGVDVTVIKSPYWYLKDAVHLDKIVFKPITNPFAAAAALEAGDVQVVDNAPTSVVPGLQQASGVHVIQTTQYGWSGVIINMGNKNGLGNLPYQNVGTPMASSPLLRQAFEEAIDRKTMGTVVFHGLVQPDCLETSPANRRWRAALTIPCTPYDPADARKLVARSGFTNPTVHLLVASVLDRLTLAQFIQAEEAAVGINVVIDSTDNVTAVSRAQAGNFDVYVFGKTASVPDPIDNFGGLETTSGTNYGGYSNPRLDYVLANALKATQFEPRVVNYRVAAEIVHDDRPVIPLYHLTTFAAYSTNVTGVEQAPASADILVAYAQLKQ